MCMLTYFPPSTQPDAEALLNGTAFNRDGHGYAIVIPGRKPKMLVRHSLNAKSLIARFMIDRRDYPKGSALFHSRFGTSGAGGKFNCHPFRVANDKRTVVAHNGVLPAVMQPDSKDKRCDTRAAADDLFAFNYGHLSSPAARFALGEDIGKHNKLVILTIDPAYDTDAYIINQGSGNWHEGVWYSNYDYEPFRPVTQLAGYFADLERISEDICPMCSSKDSIDHVQGTCSMCNSCIDCYEDLDQCVCYVPNALALPEAD